MVQHEQYLHFGVYINYCAFSWVKNITQYKLLKQNHGTNHKLIIHD